jgi:diguanylate cyclase (GGDEF)-like protein
MSAQFFILLVTLVVGTLVVLAIYVRTRKSVLAREDHLRAALANAHAELLSLRAILDDLDYGVVVLDQERHAQFINRAFRRIWRLPDAVADSRETFVRLMYRGPGEASYVIRPDQLGSYVTAQLSLIRTGETQPLNIRLANGDVFQFNCKTLPGDGRLLTYDNVSHLVHRADTLEQLAATDVLTGLNNRRQLLTLAEREWARFRRYGRPLSFLMIDIDRFKSINDRYGHGAGDEVIKAVAEVLAVNKRTSDIAGRLGGEEFALMLPETTLENACAAAERLRELVAQRSVPVAGRELRVTISAGVSAAAADMAGPDDLMKRADVALYEAKRSGRDRVCQFTLQPDGQACEHPIAT